MKFVYLSGRKIFKKFNKTLFCSADVRAKTSYIWWIFDQTGDVFVVYNVLSENRLGRMLQHDSGCRVF